MPSTADTEVSPATCKPPSIESATEAVEVVTLSSASCNSITGCGSSAIPSTAIVAPLFRYMWSTSPATRITDRSTGASSPELNLTV